MKHNDNGIITFDKYATETIGNDIQEIPYEAAVQKLKEEQSVNNELVPWSSGKRYSMKHKLRSRKRKTMKYKSKKHKHSKKLCRY